MKKILITITLMVTFIPSFQAANSNQVLFERSTLTHGIGDFDIECVDNHQFGSGQSTVFRPAINIKLSQKGLNQLEFLNENSNSVEFYLEDGRFIQMALGVCDNVKSKIFSSGVKESVQIALVPLSENKCSLQVHSQLRMNPTTYVQGVPSNLEGSTSGNSGSLIFGTYDLVEVVAESCSSIEIVNSPLLANVRAKAQNLAKIRIF